MDLLTSHKPDIRGIDDRRCSNTIFRFWNSGREMHMAEGDKSADWLPVVNNYLLLDKTNNISLLTTTSKKPTYKWQHTKVMSRSPVLIDSTPVYVVRLNGLYVFFNNISVAQDCACKYWFCCVLIIVFTTCHRLILLKPSMSTELKIEWNQLSNGRNWIQFVMRILLVHNE